MVHTKYSSALRVMEMKPISQYERFIRVIITFVIWDGWAYVTMIFIFVHYYDKIPNNIITRLEFGGCQLRNRAL